MNDVDVRYCVEYEYNYRRNCGSYGCDDEGICRCGKYEDCSVEEIDYVKLADQFAGMYCAQANKEIFAYCIERILRKRVGLSDFYFDIGGGYYGQEIDGIYLEEESTFCKMFKEMAKQSVTENVNTALEAEYGYLLPKLEGCTWELQTALVDEVRIGSDNHYRKLDKSYIDRYNKWDGIVCLVDCNNKIVDGYHRFKASQNVGRDEFKILKAVK
jgi:hypothetical protein